MTPIEDRLRDALEQLAGHIDDDVDDHIPTVTTLTPSGGRPRRRWTLLVAAAAVLVAVVVGLAVVARHDRTPHSQTPAGPPSTSAGSDATSPTLTPDELAKLLPAIPDDAVGLAVGLGESAVVKLVDASDPMAAGRDVGLCIKVELGDTGGGACARTGPTGLLLTEVGPDPTYVAVAVNEQVTVNAVGCDLVIGSSGQARIAACRVPASPYRVELRFNAPSGAYRTIITGDTAPQPDPSTPATITTQVAGTTDAAAGAPSPTTPSTTAPTTAQPTATTLDEHRIEQDDLIGRWRLDGSDTYLVLTSTLQAYAQGCPDVGSVGTWSLNGQLHLDLTTCVAADELEGTTVSRGTNGTLLAERDGVVHQLVPTFAEDGVDLAHGSLYGIVPRQEVDPELLTQLLTARTGQTVEDSGWFPVEVLDSGDCWGGPDYRILSAGDLHLLLRNGADATTSVLQAWIVGDINASALGGDRFWGSAQTGDATVPTAIGTTTVAVGSAWPSGSPWSEWPTERLPNGEVRHVDAGVTLGGSMYVNVLTDQTSGLITGLGASINGC